MSKFFATGFEIPLALGLLRLGTEGRPTEAEAVRVIHAALDAGIRLFDTADSYCLSDSDFHYGEKLMRKALSEWAGDAEHVKVITKVGLVRPKGKWFPNGKPDHIRKSVETSLTALGVERLPLLMLHALDPKTPFEASLGALVELRAAGKVAEIGLCNIGIPEFWQAQRLFPVAAIQNELSVIDRGSAKEGTVELCRRMKIPFLAHRPLGGHAKTANLLKNRAMAPVAAKHKCTPHQAALATLWKLAPNVIPIIGATKIESIISSVAALKIRLAETECAAIQTKISFESAPEFEEWMTPPEMPEGLRKLKAKAKPGKEPEIVMIMGIQGAGKSTLVQEYLDEGFERLNRDMLGGSLDDLIPKLSELLAAGNKRVVLDNTYATRVSRSPVIRKAHQFNVPVRCKFLETPIRDAFLNVANRLLERYDFLPGPEELKELSKTDPNLPPPAAMAKWAASFEPPLADEGFSAVDMVPFVRRDSQSGTEKGLLLDVDGTLRTTKSGEIYPREPDDIEILPGRKEILRKWRTDGYRLFLVSNQSGVASGSLTKEAADACFQRTVELLDVPIEETIYCPHPAFPAGCFCRKPMPGMGVLLMRKYNLSQQELIMVGDMGSDQEFAANLGAKYVPAEEFFGGG